MARGLSAELAVAAAMELADEHGLAAVTMAAVAKRCGFTTMSLYRHVSGKDELVRRMLDTALGSPPDFDVSSWRVGLGGWCRAMLAVLERHPWGIDVPITGVLGTNAQLSWLDRALEAMRDTGLSEGDKAEIALLLNGLVFWMARLRFQVTPESLEVIPAAMSLDRYPYLARAVAAGIFEDDTGPDDDFEYALERVLDGVEVLVARTLGDRA